MKTILPIALAIGVLLVPGSAGAATVQITASKDNTLYQPASGAPRTATAPGNICSPAGPTTVTSGAE